MVLIAREGYAGRAGGWVTRAAGLASLVAAIACAWPAMGLWQPEPVPGPSAEPAGEPAGEPTGEPAGEPAATGPGVAPSASAPDDGDGEDRREGRPREPRTGPSRVAHVHLTGDLDTIACAERLRDQIDEALDDGATMLLLEIDADRTRPDVLLALAETIRASEMPTIGFLIDERDRRVSSPALALALAVADRVAIDPRTAVQFRRGDWRVDVLPEGLAPEEAIEGFRMAVQRALASREIDPTLANAWTPEAEAPDGLEVEARLLGGVGISAIIAQTPAQVLRAIGHRGPVPRATEITTSLAPAQDEVMGLLRHADDAIEASRRGLNLSGQRPDRREVTVHDHRRAGREALDRLAVAAEAVDRAEVLLREFPEILLSAPPERTDIGSTPTTLRTAWRYTIDDLRRDIDYWRERATDSASR